MTSLGLPGGDPSQPTPTNADWMPWAQSVIFCKTTGGIGITWR